jgi:hypothetical protein
MLLIAEENKNSGESKDLYEKCLIIYEYLSNNNAVYSMDRHLKIARIKNYKDRDNKQTHRILYFTLLLGLLRIKV